MIIKRLEKIDLPKIAEIRNKHLEYLRQWKPLNMIDQENWINSTKDIYWSIFTNKFWCENDQEWFDCDNKLVGTIALTYIDWVSRHAELSLITEDYVNFDYVESPIKEVLGYAFNILNMHKVYNEVYEYDKQKQDLWGKFGWKKECEIRDNICYNGKYYKSYMYSILEDEWRK